MRLLVFGATGQVASELRRRAPEATFLGRAEADLSQTRALPGIVRRHRPDAVINAAAWTAVDRAEEEPRLAGRINAAAPATLAVACRDIGAPFVHISTDYVFDGSGTRPWRPEDPTDPLGAYGRSKLAGEEGVREAGGVHVILRTSWVFSAHGTNFVRTMLRLAETRDRIRVVADQVGGPTPAGAIAEACLVIARALAAEPARSGTYHFAGAPDASWADFAREIFRQAGRAVTVEDIPTSEWPTPARRPLNSRLDCSATEAAFGLSRPDWRAHLTGVLSELGALP
ncbi:MAG: dTDP-4-dehydrorhamnose reductase [Rhodobacteraceae bacterium]|nr:dTDP-4-dehydrorhamnose reductase [Paracoccaceae bacterium]